MHEMMVVFTGMPESNGKRNWTVFLVRKNEEGLKQMMNGKQIYCSEYYDRARYEADHLRWVIGEIATKPSLFDYDPDIKEPVTN